MDVTALAFAELGEDDVGDLDATCRTLYADGGSCPLNLSRNGLFSSVIITLKPQWIRGQWVFLNCR